MSIFRGIGGSGDATGDASNQAIIAINAANAALVSSGQAATQAAIATAQADLAIYNATVATEAAATATAASLLAEGIATTLVNAHVNNTTDAHDASAISNIPSGNLVAVNVQLALDELQTDVDTRADATTTTNALNLKVDKTSSTGSAVLPVGTTAQRDTGTPTGYLRYNSTLTQFEGYGAAGWGNIAGVGDASETVKGIVELATNSEVRAGTDTVRAVTPAGVAQVTKQLQSITCTQSAGALTFTLNPTIMAMRSPTLTTGVPSTVQVDTARTLVLPSGGTLGFPTTISGRIIQVLMSNGELAIISLSGGVSLSEEGVINTTAISAASTANNIFYSTTARTGQTYRVVGAVDAVNTAGAWGNPSLVQPMGGNALTAMGSLGVGQTWQTVTRVAATTYYNTTGKPIIVVAYSTTSTGSSLLLSVNGIVVSYSSHGSASSTIAQIHGIVPASQYYSISIGGGAIASVAELR